MATEGVILYLMLVKVFPTSSEGPKKRLLFICSWGKLPCYERVVGWRRAAHQFGKRKISVYAKCVFIAMSVLGGDIKFSKRKAS